MACAALVRGTASFEKTVTPAFASFSTSSGTRLDDDLEAILDEPAHGLGHEPNPTLALGHLPHDSYLHAPDYSVGSDVMLTGPTVPP
jgi:hypothetical protein